MESHAAVERRKKKRVLVCADTGPMWSPGDNEPDYKEVLSLMPSQVTLGAVLIATIIRDAGYQVEVLDNHAPKFLWKRLDEALSRKPDVVCVSTTFTIEKSFVTSLVARVRSVCPHARIVFGGGGLISQPELANEADYSVPGDGEEAIVPLLDAMWESEKPSPEAVVQPPQVNGRPLKEVMDFNADITGYFPDWGLLNRGPNELFVLETQRGCRWRCAFCNIPARAGNRMRYKTIAQVLEEIERNKRFWGIHRYIFADSTLNSPLDRCIDLLRAIARLPFKIEWVAYARVDQITEEFAAAAKASGCIDLFLGIESGDDRILRAMNKGFDLEKIRKGIKILRDHDLSFTVSWLVGFPGETKESVGRTKDLMLEIMPRFNAFHRFHVSELSPVALRKGMGGYVPKGLPIPPQETLLAEGETQAHLNDLIAAALKEGLWTTSPFGFGMYAVLGLTVEQILDLTDVLHRHWRRGLLQEEERISVERKFAEWIQRLRELALAHPVNGGALESHAAVADVKPASPPRTEFSV